MEPVVVVMITFIVMLSIVFEYGREWLSLATADAFQPILKSLYGELTLLGFMGLILFAVFKMDSIHALSTHLFEEANEIPELGEQVHMVLFFVMALFLVQSVFMTHFGAETQAKWHMWEAQSLSSKAARRNNAELKAAFTMATNPVSLYAASFPTRFPDKYRLLVHTTVRLNFMEEAGLTAANFDFARYLGIALGVVLGEMVEVPVKTWFVLEVVLLFFWQLELHTPTNARLALWIATGYVIVASLYVIHGKLRLVLHEYCKPIILRSQPQSTSVPYNTVDPEKQLSFKRKRLLQSQKRSSSKSVLLKLREWTAKRFWRPRGSRAETTPMYNVVGEDEKSEYIEGIWGGREHKAHTMFAFIRFLSLMISIYVAVFSLLYVKDVLESFDDSDSSEAAEASRRRGGVVGGVLILSAAFVPPVLYIIKITRVIEDFTIVSHISELKNRRLIESVLRWQKTVAAFEALKVVQCLGNPEMLLRVLAEATPSIVPEEATPEEDDTTSRRGTWHGEEVTEKGRKSIAQTLLRPFKMRDAQTPSRVALMCLKDEEGGEALELRQRSHWQRIYDIFDNDGDGLIDHTNMRVLLTNFSPKMTPDQLDDIVNGLDEDNSGSITFDEFLVFALKLAHFLEHVGDPEDLLDSMFSLIDRDGGGTITVYEMHKVVSDLLNQDLSVQDVFAIIQHIDVDGNGELDKEEFGKLLDYLGVYQTSQMMKKKKLRTSSVSAHDSH